MTRATRPDPPKPPPKPPAVPPPNPYARFLGWFAPGLGLAVILTVVYLQHVKPLIDVPDPDDPQQVAMGARLYDKNCAACHGADLEGRAARPGEAAVPPIGAGSRVAGLGPAEALAPIADPAPDGPHDDVDMVLAQRRYLKAFLADRWRGGAAR